MSRERDCDRTITEGRRARAEQFAEAAEIVDALQDGEGDLTEALVTLWIHAGIAAADVVCCVRLGRHAQGEDHNQATTLLAKADPELAKALGRLLAAKTRAGYGFQPLSVEAGKRARRAVDVLLEAMRATPTP